VVIHTQPRFDVGFQGPATHGLAGICTAYMDNLAAYRVGAKVMIEADDPVHFGPGLLQLFGGKATAPSGM
jgi:hypothetical protein